MRFITAWSKKRQLHGSAVVDKIPIVLTAKKSLGEEKTAAMCLGNIIGTYGSQSIQSNWDEGWQKVFKNKNRKHHKSRSKR